MITYQPIPGAPGYEVNGLGQVRGRSGKVLKHDPDGRVQINTPRGPRRLFVGELMPKPMPATDAPALETSPDDQDALRRRIDHLERVIMEYEAAHGSFDPFGGDA